jgi:flagellar biosynthesis GTPase FlhF
MGKETVITAPTMAEALSKVRRELGRDALILNHEESGGKVSITARSDKTEASVIAKSDPTDTTNNKNNSKPDDKKTDIPSWIRPLSPPSKIQDHTSKPLSAQSIHLSDITSDSKNESKSFNRIADEQKTSQLNIPVKRSNFKKFINPTSAFDETLSAISAVCDLCEFHQLGDALGEAWLRAMNPEFTHAPIQLIPALDRVIPTNQNWLSELMLKKQAVLVGPPGAGKTVTIAKLAAMLLEQGKKVRVITLDTVKASGAWQLEEYLKPLSLQLYIGSEYLPVARPKEIILIDTPALNITLPRNQEYLKNLRTKINVPFTLVLPADMNPAEAEEVAQSYLEADTDTLIVTRLELSKRCGVPLRAAYQGLKLTLVSKSPELMEGLQCATPELMLEKMLAACEISL